MPAQTLAAVFRGLPDTIELVTIPTPRPRGSEILVRVESCTLCGSDLHSFQGRRNVAVPTILGHEICGRIEAFGPHAPKTDASGLELQIGTRIIWGLVAACGECFCCQRGLSQKCIRAVKYGHQAFAEGYELLGGLAEHCLLMPGTTIVCVPEEIRLEIMTPCSCATATIAAALEPMETLQNRTVLIAGAGLLGLTAAAMARSMGASEVIVCDLNEVRLKRAREFGATHCTTPLEVPVVVSAATGGYGVDLALELSGAPAAFDLLWPQLRLGGIMALVGAVFPSQDVLLSMEQIVRRNLTICGIHNYGPRHLIQAVQFLKEHSQTYPFESVVTQWFNLAEAEQALREALNRDNIRIGVRP